MLKTPILKRNLIYETYQGKLIIGVMGTHKGVGVTHSCILLANYLGRCLGKKTALIECYPQNDFKFIEDELVSNDNNMKESKSFELHKVTYYKSIKSREISEIIGDDYDCVVLDLGCDLINGKYEFLRCDKKLVISSMIPWKLHELDKFVMNNEHIKNSYQWIYLIPFGSKKDINIIKKDFNLKVNQIPCEPDPFIISSSVIQLFQTVI
ncbi:MAG: hypothetical protein K0S41_1139 [Anaerocolumna sp.]|jgi:hypothetical protein|nr:hypothetical protein [Anaerocolumna sp.]